MVKNEFAIIIGNTTATKEHVSKTEESICVLEEQTPGIVGTLPFELIPRKLKMEFV